MRKLSKKLLVSVIMIAMMFAFSTTAFADTVDQAAVPADGTYKVTANTGEKMFKVTNAVLKVENGKMSAVITLSGTGYSYLYAGTVNPADTDELDVVAEADRIPFVVNEDGAYTYEVPVASLDTALDFGSYSTKNGKWYDRKITFDSKTLVPEKDGYYTITASTGEKMFKITDAVLKVENGKMSAVITLSGTGYGYLYAGVVNTADTDTLDSVAEADRIPFVVNESGAYTYEVPVAALNTPLDFGSYSTKNGTWYDRHITFDANTLNFVKGLNEDVVISDDDNNTTPDTDLFIEKENTVNPDQNTETNTEINTENKAAKEVQKEAAATESSVPKTGDDSNLLIMIGLLVASAGTAAVVNRRSRA